MNRASFYLKVRWDLRWSTPALPTPTEAPSAERKSNPSPGPTSSESATSTKKGTSLKIKSVSQNGYVQSSANPTLHVTDPDLSVDLYRAQNRGPGAVAITVTRDGHVVVAGYSQPDGTVESGRACKPSSQLPPPFPTPKPEPRNLFEKAAQKQTLTASEARYLVECLTNALSNLASTDIGRATIVTCPPVLIDLVGQWYLDPTQPIFQTLEVTR